MTDEKTITEEIECFDDVGGYTPYDVPLAEAIKRLQAALEAVPEQFRDTAILHIWASSGGDWDAHIYPEVQYTRPETDDERRARLQKEQRSLTEREARERAMYATLKAKYG